jgi:hypothetical protein
MCLLRGQCSFGSGNYMIAVSVVLGGIDYWRRGRTLIWYLFYWLSYGGFIMRLSGRLRSRLGQCQVRCKELGKLVLLHVVFLFSLFSSNADTR